MNRGKSEAHRRGIDTAIETAGNVLWESFRRVIEHVDTVLHDHKFSEPARHKRWVGVDNARIQVNYQRAYTTFPKKTFIARSTIVPGVNDDEGHIRAVLAFIRPYPNVVDYQLLPYHRYGEGDYGFLGRVYALKDFPSLSAETLQRLQRIIDEADTTEPGTGQKGPPHRRDVTTAPLDTERECRHAARDHDCPG